MEVEAMGEALGSEPAAEIGEAGPRVDGDDFVESGVRYQQRREGRLGDVADPGVRMPRPERADEGRRQKDVAQGAESDQYDAVRQARDLKRS
jgi:hypothetical protein